MDFLESSLRKVTRQRLLILLCFQILSRWWFQIYIHRFVIFTPFREDSHFDSYFSNGLVQPPTSPSPLLVQAGAGVFFPHRKVAREDAKERVEQLVQVTWARMRRMEVWKGFLCEKRQIQYVKRSKSGGKVDDFHSISLMLNPLPLHEIASFWTSHFNDASTKYSDSKWCAKNVQALEDGRDFDPNELEELITLVEDIMGWKFVVRCDWKKAAG